MDLQARLQSNGKKKAAAANSDEDEDLNLNQLASQTLSGVKPNLLPPEPFPSGFDLSALASSSRSTRPPPAETTSTEDTGGRIDLRALAQSAAPPAAQSVQSRPPPRTLPPRKRHGARDSVPAGVAAAAPSLQAAPAARELDELIASRAFSPGSQLGARAAQALAVVRRAPAWTWGVAAGIVIGVVIASGPDEGAQPAVAAASASATADGTTTTASSLPLAAASLPQVTSVPHSRAAATRVASSAGQRRVPAARDDRADGQTPATAAGAQPVDPESAEDRTIDTLLDQAIGGRALQPAAPAPRPRSAPSLPDLPARDAVASVLGGLQSRMRFCAGDHTGVATANLVVKNDGRVTSARVSGAPFSRTAAGRCMESVLRGARFPRFGKPTFKVSYPFQL